MSAPAAVGAGSGAAGAREASDVAALLSRIGDASGVASDWLPVLTSAGDALAEVAAFLEAERTAGSQVLPGPSRVLRALGQPLADVRVLIVGQDPYPTPGNPVGLAFAADKHVRPLPASVRNIYQELESDLGHAPVPHADLGGWAEQGVLLLNRVLTVRAGEAGSHRGHGWEGVTEAIIAALDERGGPLVAILWGNDARSLAPLLPGAHVIESAHPSPLSARRGFFGSRPFSRANEALAAMGAQPIDWRVDPSFEHSTPVALF